MNLEDSNETLEDMDIYDHEIVYSDAKALKEKLPDEFFGILLTKLVKIFPNCLKPLIFYDLHSSSAGWHEALEETCNELKVNWVLDYWNAQPWYNSDILDGVIEDEIITRYLQP